MALDALSQILDAMQMRGSVYFHTNFTPPWGVKVPAYRNVVRFHLVFRGQCWARVDGAETAAIPLATGDLIIIPHGAAHILSDTPDREATVVDQVLALSGYNGEGALVFGGQEPGHEARLFCGHFEFDESVTHPMLASLPRYIHLPSAETLNIAWFEPVMRFVTAEVLGARAGANAIVHRLTEIIFIQVVRAFVDRAGDAAGCFAGVLNPQIGRALASVHAAPEKEWTVDRMAREAGMSRTLFAERFANLVGMTPVTYVTYWRMHQARRYLSTTDLPMVAIAEKIGYRSESALTRAFKRQFATTPGAVRKEQR